jgi:hypothetical protein
MTDKKEIISGSVLKHLRKEISGLISVILKCDSECKDCDENFERLYDILGELLDCTDVMPDDDIHNVNELLDAKDKLPEGSTYGMMARKLRPVVEKIVIKS